MERGEGTVALRQRRGGGQELKPTTYHTVVGENLRPLEANSYLGHQDRSQPVAEGEDGLTLEVAEARASHVSEPRPRGMDGGTAPGLHR